jgi:hypothetical protein
MGFLEGKIHLDYPVGKLGGVPNPYSGGSSDGNDLESQAIQSIRKVSAKSA